jgi:hypothetical protein
MSYQFLHIETYSRKPTKAGRSEQQFNSTEQVFGEAMRTPKYSTHIDNPEPPNVITTAGAIHPIELKELHDQIANNTRLRIRSAAGKEYERRLKTDAKTLYTEIHSHPAKPSDLHGKEGLEKDLDTWLTRIVTDFKQRMLADVQFSIVVHLDESRVHCHILAININDPKLDANKLHVGKAAAAKYRQEHPQRQTAPSLPRPALIPSPFKPRKPRVSSNPLTLANNQDMYVQSVGAWQDALSNIKERNETATQEWKRANSEHVKMQRRERTLHYSDKTAYTQALIDLQDNYYDAVGQYCGLLRVGPRTQRLTTKEASTRKLDAARMAKSRSELAIISKSLQQREQYIKAAEVNLTQREENIDQANKSLLANQDEIRIAQEAIADALAKFASENVQLGGIVFNAYVYDAYDIPELNRTAMQHQVTTLIDGLILAHKRAGKSTGPKPNYTNRIG